MLKHALLAATLLAAMPAFAQTSQKPLRVGMTVGSLGNPYFVATVKGARAEAM